MNALVENALYCLAFIQSTVTEIGFHPVTWTVLIVMAATTWSDWRLYEIADVVVFSWVQRSLLGWWWPANPRYATSKILLLVLKSVGIHIGHTKNINSSLVRIVRGLVHGALLLIAVFWTWKLHSVDDALSIAACGRYVVITDEFLALVYRACVANPPVWWDRYYTTRRSQVYLFFFLFFIGEYIINVMSS